MRRVRIQRIFHNGLKGFVALGNPIEGLEPLPPTVGKQYMLFADSGRLIRTSLVAKVQDGIFETLNSIYKITILEQEPFDLAGQDPTENPQELNW